MTEGANCDLKAGQPPTPFRTVGDFYNKPVTG
jgi:hypothetical protein